MFWVSSSSSSYSFFLVFFLGFSGFLLFLILLLGSFFYSLFWVVTFGISSRVGDLFGGGGGGERGKLCFCVLCVSVSGATTHLFIHPSKAMVLFSIILCASTRGGILLGGGF